MKKENVPLLANLILRNTVTFLIFCTIITTYIELSMDRRNSFCTISIIISKVLLKFWKSFILYL